LHFYVTNFDEMILALPRITLETDRFQLRSMTPEDVPALSSYTQTEPQLWKYALVPMTGPDDMRLYVDEALEQHALMKTMPFVVIEKTSGEIVGSTRFYDLQLQYGYTQLGYTWYTQRLHGSGINAHCKYLLLQYAFEELNLERVEFRADTRNAHSLAAMRKLGCIEEGILRNHLPTADGTRRDSIIFSILKAEWHASVKAGLEKRLDR
jgi:N-acetyltransferase